MLLLRSLTPAAPWSFLGHFLCKCSVLETEATAGLSVGSVCLCNFSELDDFECGVLGLNAP